ncbi:MAG: hypothetical protein RLZZ127_2297 [Planctomycetota bacterium]|jgi:phosphate transport system permease protein
MSIASDNRRPRGEAQVWLTAMGLAVGIAMVSALIGVILWNGLTVFWPKPVLRWTVEQDGVQRQVVGQVVDRRSVRPVGAPATAAVVELQVFTANKQHLGQPFGFIPEAGITSSGPVAGALVIERWKNGTVVGVPIGIALPGSPALPATAPGFAQAMAQGIARCAAWRSEGERIRRHEIGVLARQQERIRLDVLRAPAGATAALQARFDAIQADIETLTAQAVAIEAKMEGHDLALRIGAGANEQVVTVGLGEIVDLHAPNELGIAGKAGVFLGRLWAFLTAEPREVNTEGGIFPAIVGTFTMTLMMTLVVVPFGVIAALYLREYARQGALVRFVRISVNNLAGVPSIVFGVFGLGFFVYVMGAGVDWLFFPGYDKPVFRTGGILWAAATLALMTVPVVIVATEEAVAAVPRGAREGSLACGASKWQTIQRIVLPAAVPGIITGAILAMARGAGEVAPLMMVGVIKFATELPVDGEWLDTDLVPFVHLNQKFMHLGFHIYDLGFQSPDSDAARPMVFATTLFLILLVLVLNLGAILLRERLRRKFQSSTF